MPECHHDTVRGGEDGGDCWLFVMARSCSIMESMLKEYGTLKGSRLSWPGRLLAFILACFIFVSAIYLIFQLFSLVSTKHRKAFKEELAREEAFLRSLDFYIVASGYVKKSSGQADIYVPTIQLNIANASGRVVRDLWLSANFERAGEFLCRAERLVAGLEPGESREVRLSCSETTLVGTVFTGLSLAQTTEDLSYAIWARSNEASVSLLKDVLKFKLVQDRGRY